MHSITFRFHFSDEDAELRCHTWTDAEHLPNTSMLNSLLIETLSGNVNLQDTLLSLAEVTLKVDSIEVLLNFLETVPELYFFNIYNYQLVVRSKCLNFM